MYIHLLEGDFQAPKGALLDKREVRGVGVDDYPKGPLKALEDGPFSTKQLRECREGPDLGFAEEAPTIVQYPPKHLPAAAARQYSRGKEGRDESRTWCFDLLPAPTSFIAPFPLRSGRAYRNMKRNIDFA